MERWPIERSWEVIRKDHESESLRTGDLRRYKACIMLGAAGLGKTYELKYLSEKEKGHSHDVRYKRLAELGVTPESLESNLRRLSIGATGDIVLYLDALDEVMVPVRTAATILGNWIRDELQQKRPSLRLSCRSAVWPDLVGAEVLNVYGDDSCAIANLGLLSEDDIRRIAAGYNIDSDKFLSSLSSSGAFLLSQYPLTLNMLINLFRKTGAIPSGRNILFDEGIRILATEQTQRHISGTANIFSENELLEVAERLACFTLFSGRETINMDGEADADCLGRTELSGLPGGNRQLDFECVNAIARSGLVLRDGEWRFRFAHRQFAEYLAGRRIARLLPHQAKALLAAGPGWRAGVAGPLRETAAFAAMNSPKIAEWLVECDPEVIGLSDVSDDTLRRRATLNMVQRFREHVLTDTQLDFDGLPLKGFQYRDSESDLAGILRERGDGCEDVLEFAIELIESWDLRTMSDDLATLVLDSAAPLQARKRAGYALQKMGGQDVKRRLLPLINHQADDPKLDLKGISLRCNWPEAITIPELLNAIATPYKENYLGAYSGFLHTLDQDGFDASGHRIAGLVWAKRFLRRGVDNEPCGRIAKRIAIAALDEIDEPGVADALARLLLAAAEVHADSPLALQGVENAALDAASTPKLANHQATRRLLIEALVAIATESDRVWWITHHTPGLLSIEDFTWHLAKATDENLPLVQRRHHTEIARSTHWDQSLECVDAWLAVRNIEPVASLMAIPLEMSTTGDLAVKARKQLAEIKRMNSPRPKTELQPPPAERVVQALSMCLTKDPNYFIFLCKQLTLKEDSTHYSFSRFLNSTPGWMAADSDTRGQIVEAARRLLVSDSDELERSKKEPLNQLLPGHITALFLVMDQDPNWIDDLPPNWWKKWAWYLLREIHPNMSGEDDILKTAIIHKIHEYAPVEFRSIIVDLSTSSAPLSSELLTSLLDMIIPLDDPIIDSRLCSELKCGRIPEDSARAVAEFVLSRVPHQAMEACIHHLGQTDERTNDKLAVHVAIALMHGCLPDSWEHILDFLRRRPELGRQIFGEYAQAENRLSRNQAHLSGIHMMSSASIGQFVCILTDYYPPDTDPEHGPGFQLVGPDESARQLRDRLISWLSSQSDWESVCALKSLELKYGSKSPWLRRPRSRAERSYQMAHWTPVNPKIVAEILSSNDKRLIKSGADAMDGIVAAIEDYATRLGANNELEDLWNVPKNYSASPKSEERVSDKIRQAVMLYFENYAMCADREVQIQRRILPVAQQGAPGSKCDVLCFIPSAGTVQNESINIPIEVKLSHNPEARTGFQDQLIDRYMKQLVTDYGVFVVVWMGKIAGGSHQPLWPSIEAAKSDLSQLEQQVKKSNPSLDVRIVVIDASLPTAANSKPPSP